MTDGDSDRRQRDLLAVVARYLGADVISDASSPPGPPCLRLADRSWPIEIAPVELHQLELTSRQRPRLRFDKVVLRLVADLQHALQHDLPTGKAVVLTLTAPIRVPGRTTQAIEVMIRDGLKRRTAKTEIRATLHENEVGVGVIDRLAPTLSQVIGLVHNPDLDPRPLFDMSTLLLRAVSDAIRRLEGRAAAPPSSSSSSAEATPSAASAAAGANVTATDDRPVLVVAVSGSPPALRLCRQVCTQLVVPACFARALVVFETTEVEPLQVASPTAN